MINYLHSTLWSTINCHLFLQRRMLHAEVTGGELGFADKTSLQTSPGVTQRKQGMLNSRVTPFSHESMNIQ